MPSKGMEKTQTEITAEALVGRHDKELALKLSLSRCEGPDGPLYQRVALLIGMEGSSEFVRETFKDYACILTRFFTYDPIAT